MLYRTYIAVLCAFLALCAWGLVGFFAWTISADESARVASTENAQREAIMGASSIRTHALAVDTAKEGEALKKLLNVDVVSASYMIEEVGKIAGVKVMLGDAQPEKLPESGGVALKAIGFTVTAQGKFSDLMRAVRLFETLPIPARVVRLDIQHTPDSSKASNLWQMNIYIRVLTTSDISS